MVDKRIGLPQGTLDFLILKVLSLGPQHGWAISERLDQVSTGVVQVQQGRSTPLAPARASRLDRSRVGSLGQQPECQVLRADAGGPQAARNRNRRLADALAHHRPDTGHRLRSHHPSMSSMFSDLKYRLRATSVASPWRPLAAELQFHCEQQAAKLVAAGVPRDEALRRARPAIGGVEQVKEECREARGVAVLEFTAADFR